MDDYNLWVPIEMGYFEELGLDVTLEPGPMDAFACTKFVDQNQADLGYPSPGILTASVDQGMNVIMAYEMMIGSVWKFAVRPDSDIKSPKELAGKTIALGDMGWKVIVDPLLVELGIDPNSVNYVAAGQQWGQMVAQGKADAALAWLALDVQWEAAGIKLKYFEGSDFSVMPSNGYCVRKTDLDDPKKRDVLVRFLKGTSMGLHFGRFNPQAAAQIVYERFPAVREQMTPEVALESMRQLAYAYVEGERRGLGYGAFVPSGWQKYLDIIYQLGQTKRHLTLEETITDELVEEANDFDRKRVEKDAKSFKLNDTWKNVKPKGPFF
ncbi:MAG: ABC transporter substrate-binding protein [Spirochaetes bacterium]|mgnify:CR=1 FL=1|nr:MAG: ABC transporter substrate-binding protein [Spirochaetota bacterium]